MIRSVNEVLMSSQVYVYSIHIYIYMYICNSMHTSQRTVWESQDVVFVI